MSNLEKVLENEIEQLKKSLYNSNDRLKIHYEIEEKKQELIVLKSENNISCN